jgi:NAD(P)-dependent dehydrogenase (short-subunit alcohol dehydrogenase family)
VSNVRDGWQSYALTCSCTGYGVIGSCEDQDDHDLRSQFETNFLGTLNIVQLSLPLFREQSSRREDEDEAAGRYIIFSSTSGAQGVPGLGPYCATKYATEGLIESMLYEVDAFGIKATLVEPGHMRIDEATGLDDVGVSTKHTVELRKYGHFLIKAPSAPYDSPTAPAGHARRLVQWMTDRQPVSAVKSAELTWQLGHCRYPPLRLLLGSVAVESVRDRLRSVIEEIEDWKHLQFPEQGGLERDNDDDDDDANGAGYDGDEVIEDAHDSDRDDQGEAEILTDADSRLET